MATRVVPETYPGSSGKYIYKKNNNSLCVFRSGWWAVGTYPIYERTYSGTIFTGYRQSNSDLIVLLGKDRHTYWEYNGFGMFIGTKVDKSLYVFTEEEYQCEQIIFCGCDPTELDCGNCCIDCCGLSQEIVNKLKG